MTDENEMPEHVMHMGHGGMMCKSCGGMVDAKGLAMGGADEDGDMTERPKEVGDESPQMADTERMRAFSMAVKGGK